MWVAVAVVTVLLLPGVLFVFAESQRAFPLVVRLIGFAINTAFAGALILLGVSRIRRFRRLMARVWAENLRLEWSDDGLVFASHSRSHRYRWADIGAIRTDRAYLSIGPFPTRPATALLLLTGSAPQRPGLRLRLRLARAIRRSRCCRRRSTASPSSR